MTLGYGQGDVVADSWAGLEEATATFLALRLIAVAKCHLPGAGDDVPPAR